jgi:translation initiation factor 4A
MPRVINNKIKRTDEEVIVKDVESVEKVENSVDKVDNSVEKVDNSVEKVDNSVEKVDNSSVTDSEPSVKDTDAKNKEKRTAIFELWDDEEVGLNPKVLRGIYSYGFENPSPIQKRSIIPLSNGYDIIAQAQSGTGKTGAFVVGSLNIVEPKEKKTQVLILSPTRELATQSYSVYTAISQYMKINIKLLIGGTSTEEDRKDLHDNVPHVVVGTPGRIHDMMRRGHLESSGIKLFIMDEADEMLSVGFKDQIYNIFQHLNNEVQIGLFSATMPEDVRNLTEKIMRDPVEILVKSEMLTLEGINQYYVAIDDDHVKYQVIKDIFQSVSLTQCIIYCNSVKRVQNLTDAMNQDGFPVICIHSGMDDKERKDAFKDFKGGRKRVLISSDVTARGIDVQQLSVVINFDVPKSIHTYLHRIGRSGRWGRKGMAINFVTKRDMSKMKEIESWYQTTIEELPSDYAERMKFM